MNKRLRWGLIIVVIGMIAFAVGCSADAGQTEAEVESAQVDAEVVDTSWTDVVEKGEIIAGMCAMYPPFESRNADTGEFEGFDIDLSKAMSEELGVKIVNTDAEFVTLIEGVKQGQYDVIISGLSRRDEFEGNINTTDPYYKIDVSIVLLDENKDIKTLDDLKGKVVGVQSSGSATEREAEKIEGLKELKRYNYNPEIFSDLRAGRIDALVVAYTYAVAEYKAHGDIRVLEEPLKRTDLVMATAHGADELTLKINEALQAVKDSGKYDELVEKWLTLR